MTETQTPSDFAYGQNHVDDCHCPAITAGFSPTGTRKEDHIPGLLEAAEHYDSILSNRSGMRIGIVDEATAQEAWIEMLENALNQDWQRKHAALKVALELGWCDEEDYDL